ncbi:hypothetical protein CDIK_3522 [Cucumispora dikerogammari]|nr:hypothetical protein CDIK_3522 [Cucumispora dikerogammari]
MDETKALFDLKEKYKDTKTIPVDVVNRFLVDLYTQGKINRELCVTTPVTFDEIENMFNYRSENKCNKVSEEEDDEFNKYDDTRLDQARSDLNELWSSYEDERVKEIKFLTRQTRKIRDSLMFFSKITKVTGAILCVIYTWSYLEYKQVPL